MTRILFTKIFLKRKGKDEQPVGSQLECSNQKNFQENHILYYN